MSAAHPIVITPFVGRVVVRFGGAVVLDTRRALSLQEADYKPVLYLPREDAAMEHFEPSDRRSHCPYKGDARYFSLRAADALAPDAVWSYESPFAGVDAIAGHLAFYADRVDLEISPD